MASDRLRSFAECSKTKDKEQYPCFWLSDCMGLLGFCRASVSYMDCIYDILFYVLEPLGLGLTLEMVWHIQVS